MGYLPHNLRRGACRAQKLRAASIIPEGLKEWFRERTSRTARPLRRRPVRYLRLAVSERDGDSQRPLGVFQAAYRLRDQGILDPSDTQELADALAWFGKYLTVPREVPPRAIFWFSVDSHEHVRRLWTLARILRAHGREVRMYTCGSPGRVVYDDGVQVGAIPVDRRVGVRSKA